MAKPEEFARRIGRIAAKIPENAARTVRKAALAADSTVVLATPVDTGRARANWRVGVDAPVTTATTQESKTGAEAIAEGSAKIGSYKPGINFSIWISNNLPYIGRLNEGSSKQAPAGFVQRAVAAAVAAVKGAKLLK